MKLLHCFILETSSVPVPKGIMLINLASKMFGLMLHLKLIKRFQQIHNI